MNRQTVVDGVSSDDGATVKIADVANGGVQIAYDNAGNRIMSRQWGKQLVMTSYFSSWITRDGEVTETYSYDAGGRLTDSYRDGIDVEQRQYDKQARIVQSTALGLESATSETLADAGINAERHVDSYFADGQMANQSNFGILGTKANLSVLQYDYDTLGRLKDYLLGFEVGSVHTNRYDYKIDEGSGQAASITVTRTDNGVQSQTVNTIDANGFITHVQGTGSDNVKTRDLVNDAQGRVLRKTETLAKAVPVLNGGAFTAVGQHVTTTLIANGEVIGSSSDSLAPVKSTFGSDYVPVTDQSLTAGSTAYTVKQGDSLQSIAKAMWGDANLWYAIADANGISTVNAGDIILVPPKPNAQFADAQSFKPYDPNSAIGDTTPNLPAPKKHHKGWADVLAAIVAVVITVMSGGSLAGAVLASLASQAVEIAANNQHGINWKQVALSAVSAGVTQGLPTDFASDLGTIGQAMAKAAVASTITQGIGVATGLQQHFSWQAVAASAVGAGVGQAVGPVFGEAFGNTAAGQFGARLATGLVAGTAAAVMRGGKVAIQQVATDAFGQAIGGSLAEVSSGISSPASAYDYRNGSDIQSDNYTPASEYSYRNGMDIESDNAAAWREHVERANAMPGSGTSEADYWNGAASRKNFADQLARAYGPGSLEDVADRAPSRASGSNPASAYNYRNGMDIESDNYRPPAGGPGRTRPMPEYDLEGNPTGRSIDVPVPDNKLMPGENIKGNVFFGGAGMDGAYVKDFVRAFNKQGIALTPADRDTWSNGMLVDLSLGVQATRFGQVPVLPLLDNFPQSGNQFNLLGYSYGSTVAAQVAINYARGGTSVDNLVLIGSPISDDFLKTLQAEPNIRNVQVVNLNDKGDPIKAGMSNTSLVVAAPTLVQQMLNGTGQGHFYYEPSTPAIQVRRDALAEYLYQHGLR